MAEGSGETQHLWQLGIDNFWDGMLHCGKQRYAIQHIFQCQQMIHRAAFIMPAIAEDLPFDLRGELVQPIKKPRIPEERSCEQERLSSLEGMITIPEGFQVCGEEAGLGVERLDDM